MGCSDQITGWRGLFIPVMLLVFTCNSHLRFSDRWILGQIQTTSHPVLFSSLKLPLDLHCLFPNPLLHNLTPGKTWLASSQICQLQSSSPNNDHSFGAQCMAARNIHPFPIPEWAPGSLLWSLHVLRQRLQLTWNLFHTMSTSEKNLLMN